MTYCFEKAIVMRRDLGQITRENKLKVSDLLRCKARSYCGLNPRNFHQRDSDYTTCNFSSIQVITEITSMSFYQVKVLTNTDIVASPHGAQLTNMLFMDRGGSVMEFFPKGWLENAGVGQYAHHWMADQSGMKHQGAWWDPIGEDCPSPQDHLQCFLFHKDGMVGHNETYFAEWASRVIDQVRLRKVEQPSEDQAKQQHDSKACAC